VFTIVDSVSSKVNPSLGRLLGDARSSLGSSLHDVASAAGCSPAYVHKLEQDRVRTPSPRVLAGLGRALGLEYPVVMRAAGYDPTSDDAGATPVTAPRYSNAHIVELLEALRTEVADLRAELSRTSR
jgi:transcriptional regulator with XRE-family HTH domain